MKTKREKEVIQKYKEFKSRQTISLKELEDYNDSVWKLLIEMERLRKRYEALRTKLDKDISCEEGHE